jgi:hypothetical protein
MWNNRPTAGVGGLALVAFLALAAGASQAQEPSLDVVLSRAGIYVTEFRSLISGIVSEERYEQEATSPTSTGRLGFTKYTYEHVVLKSDFLLVRPPGSERTVEFRDVYEVDGRATRDREERLTKLFLNPSGSSEVQIRSIINESARYNIGLIGRTLNTPTFALLVLDPVFQVRFKFVRVDESSPELDFGTELPEDQTGVWVVEYEEVQPNTLVRGKDNKDLPIRGRFWIEPGNGRVLVSELIAKDSEVDATLDVRYQNNAILGQFVPVEMRERYNDRYGSRVDGTATYSNFRRFQVDVEEALRPENDAPEGSS